LAGYDFLTTLKKRARDRLGIVVHVEPSEKNVWIKADRYSFLNSILFLLHLLNNHIQLWEFECRFRRDKAFTALDLRWAGAPLGADILRHWQDRYLTIGAEKSPLTLKQVLGHHQAAIWTSADPTLEGYAYIRLLLPAMEPIAPETIRPITILPSHQDDFFDRRTGDESEGHLELDGRLLTELTYAALIREISEQDHIDAIVHTPKQLPVLIHQMMKIGATIRNITRLITTFTDAVLRKIIEMAIAALGSPPVPFAFIILGSEGRKEQTLKTDQDNAIIFQDILPGSGVSAAEAAGYFIKLGETVCAWLDQAGYAYCTGEVMARNPKWCQPLSVWKNYFDHWIHAAEPQDLLQASIFFDFRLAYGHGELVNSLGAYLSNALDHWSGFLRHMTANAVYYKPPIGFFGNFTVESKGPHRNRLNIKKAITLVVDFARIYALKHQIDETNTQERLYRLCLKEILTRDDFNEIDQAYDFMMQIRFARQIQAIIDENSKPDNYIDPGKLSTIEQRMLKEIFKKIEKLQSRLNFEFAGTQDSQQT
jgi:CBS domain-containing protein